MVQSTNKKEENNCVDSEAKRCSFTAAIMRKYNIRWLAFLSLLCLLPCIPIASMAQSNTGNIAGRVTDSTGAMIPRVKVTIQDVSTNTETRTETTSTGEYTAAYLLPGSYTVSFSAPGFRELVQTGLKLQLDQSLRVDAVLQVGAVNEKLEVSSSSEQVDYGSPEIGHVVGEEQLQELPLLSSASRGRSPLLLAKLVPGVTSTSSNNSNINNFSFGGGRPVSNEILVDGLPTTNPSDNTYTLTPSPDSLQEFKVITTPFSAEWGHTGGGVMLATTKSGSNDLHGSLYDLFRNRIFNDRNFFDTTGSAQKYVQNDPGVTIGGPVYLPKIYNGRNRTFFFVDFNATISSIGDVSNNLVPTAAQKAGDFSKTFDSNGNPVTIYDPATLTTGANGVEARQPFPGNIIPASRIDAVAAKIVGYYPSPNYTVNGQNYNLYPSQTQQVFQTIERLDHNFSDKDHMFVRYGHYSPNADAETIIPNNANNQNASGWRDNQFAFGETHVISPTMFSDFRAGFVQEVNYQYAGGGPAGGLGLRGVPLVNFPTITTDQFIQLGASPAGKDRDRSWIFSEAVTWQRGSQTIKFGGDYRRQMYNYYNPGYVSGAYNFTALFTTDPTTGAGGYSLADMLLGMPQDAQIQSEDYTYRMNINSAGLYFQDDIKLTPTFTLNAGLRWEFDGPYSEANNQFASFSPTAINTQTGTPGEAIFAGRNGAPSHFMPNVYHDFLPRIGFAWNFAPHTVLRGGFGMYRLPNIGYYNYGPLSKYVVNANFQAQSNLTPPFYLAQGVPAYGYNVDASGNPSVPASLTKPSSTVNYIDPRAVTPYNLSYQVGLEHQFGGGWFAEADWVANKGVKLPIEENLNQIPSEEWGPGSRSLLRPFPQYAGVTGLMLMGNSMYESLQAKLEHSWKNGLVVSAAYTFSKLIDDVDPPARVSGAWIQDVYNLNGERGIGGYDVPQRMAVNYVYNLPFGRGGTYLAHTPLLKDIIGGWQVAGISELQTGLPQHVSQPNNTNGFTDVQYVNQIAPVTINRGSLTQWFSTSSFAQSAAYTLGNAPRYPFHGPGINNTDLAIMRNFKFGEQWNLQFRGEMYNAFNHPNFRAPNSNVTSPSFGEITGAQASRIVEFALRLFF